MKEISRESIFVVDYTYCINIAVLFSESNDFDHISRVVSSLDWQIKTLSDVYSTEGNEESYFLVEF
jgi:hypothetical protein